MNRALIRGREVLRIVITHHWFLPFCLISGVVLRLLWIWFVTTPQVSDFVWYYHRALSIAEGHGYSVDGIPTAYWPVGYPGFLGVLFRLCGPSLLVAKLVNIILYTGGVLLIYWVSKRLVGSEPAARITVCLLCFYPNEVAYTSLLSTEIFFSFLLLLGAVAFIQAQGRSSWLVLAGTAWGIAALTKPQGIIVPLLFGLVFFTSKKTFCKRIAILYGVVLLVLLPWAARNYNVFGRPLLSTNGGIVLMIGNNPYATGKQIWDKHVMSLLGPLAADEEHLFDGNEVRREAAAASVAFQFIRGNPGKTLARLPRKLSALYTSDTEGIYYSLGMMDARGKDIRVWAVRVVAEVYYILIMGLCCAGLPAIKRLKIKGRWIGVIIIGVFTVVYLMAFGNPRYHFALMPWFALYAGIGGWMVVNGGTWTSEGGREEERREPRAVLR